MELTSFLNHQRAAILEKWFQKILEQYPIDASSFLNKERNPFANPVGNALREGIQPLLDCLIQGEEDVPVAESLDRIIRIKAVQDFPPSQAVDFIFQLKQVMREEMDAYAAGEFNPADIRKIDARIDRFALMAFDIYMECREKIYEIRANQVKNRSMILLQRSNLLSCFEEEALPSNPVDHQHCGKKGECAP